MKTYKAYKSLTESQKKKSKKLCKTSLKISKQCKEIVECNQGDCRNGKI